MPPSTVNTSLQVMPAQASGTGASAGRTEGGFVWPMPPLPSYPLPGSRMDAQLCELEATSGQRIVGRLLSLDMTVGMVQVHVPPDPATLPMQLDQLRQLTLTRPISPLSAVPPQRSRPAPLEGGGGDTPSEFPSDWAVLGQHPRQGFKVHWADGGVSEGETIGHIEHPAGLFVFPPVDSQGSVLRRFYPRSAYDRFEIGAPIGQVLVEQRATTAEQVDAALRDQQQLRRRKLGEILLTRQIVTAEQLLVALDKQARMPMVRLGDALVALGFLTGETLHEALKQQRDDRVAPLGELLVQRGLVQPEQLTEALARKMGYPLVDVTRFPLPRKCLKLLPRELAERHGALPLGTRGGRLVVALSDPTRADVLAELQAACKVPLIPVLAQHEALIETVVRAYAQRGAVPDPAPASAEAAADAEHPAEAAEAVLQAAVTALRDDPPALPGERSPSEVLRRLLQQALQMGATDVHIEARSLDAPLQVQVRRDGRLETLEDLPATCYAPLLAHAKQIAALDLDVHDRAQSGRVPLALLLPAPAPQAELQLSTLPTHQGLEDVVLRLPMRLALRKPVHVGWETADQERLLPLLQRTAGLILVAGPARSGRTSTLHTLLAQLDTTQRKVWTVEERLEITQSGLRQSELRPETGWTCGAALRGLAAADPDVVMVGELRDAEAARAAVALAADGRLVLAGVTARNAGDAVTRLLDHGVDASQLGDALLAVNAQRLLPRVCRHCRMSRPAKDSEIDDWLSAYLDHALTKEPQVLRQQLLQEWTVRRGRDGRLRRYVGAGCDHCHGTGLRPRVAAPEVMVVSRELRRLIRAQAPSWHLQQQMRKEGQPTLRQDAIEKLLAGLALPESLRDLSD
jgi:type II secretory ATPase GspE/PulE/Tfp pilus assembly ATPase PilB-like protein